MGWTLSFLSASWTFLSSPAFCALLGIAFLRTGPFAPPGREAGGSVRTWARESDETRSLTGREFGRAGLERGELGGIKVGHGGKYRAPGASRRGG